MNRPFPNSFYLCFKASPGHGLQPFKWKRVYLQVHFHANQTHFYFKMVSHQDSFWNRGKRRLGNGLHWNPDITNPLLVSAITNDIFQPDQLKLRTVKCMDQNPDITNPCYPCPLALRYIGGPLYLKNAALSYKVNFLCMWKGSWTNFLSVTVQSIFTMSIWNVEYEQSLFPSLVRRARAIKIRARLIRPQFFARPFSDREFLSLSLDGLSWERGTARTLFETIKCGHVQHFNFHLPKPDLPQKEVIPSLHLWSLHH